MAPKVYFNPYFCDYCAGYVNCSGQGMSAEEKRKRILEIFKANNGEVLHLKAYRIFNFGLFRSIHLNFGLFRSIHLRRSKALGESEG